MMKVDSISDLGLSSVVPPYPSEKITIFVKGTPGYIDPHYRKYKKCSSKTDVYAFGVVLLELLTGIHVTSGRIIPDPDVTDLANWIQRQITDDQTLKKIIDPNVYYEIHPNCRKSFAKLTCKTLQNDPRKRPTMSTVVAQLEEALALQTGTYPSSSKTDVDLHYHFNTRPSETSETHDISVESRPTSRLQSTTTESDVDFNIFSSYESSEKRDVLDQSRPTGRLRSPAPEMKTFQSRNGALTIPRAEDVLPKTLIGFIQKKREVAAWT
ncbi:hypothetical protein L1987_32236 [Smallanthus sonchifolius]|uniref:Uncharacterized protein n=1 Tax=Smallanthus sonchifolius TaxID=185202 RepID=A0ACB9I7L3_9ASTR|nr:hypothetical protein L1987_32236 [Smallanthus sonchifolius]